MKIEFIKQPGGTLTPVDDMEAEKLTRFKTGEQYQVEIKMSRNPDFHRKVFAFFRFCFDHWAADKTLENMDINEQFGVFRENLTVLAGYKHVFYTITGEARVEAKSLSYANMEQDEFEACYKALIQAAINHIFGIGIDQWTRDQLYSFF